MKKTNSRVNEITQAKLFKGKNEPVVEPPPTKSLEKNHERKSTKDDENQRLARIETPQNNQPKKNQPQNQQKNQ